MLINILNVFHIFDGKCGLFYLFLKSLYFLGIFLRFVWVLTLSLYFLMFEGIDVSILQLLIYVLSIKVLQRNLVRFIL